MNLAVRVRGFERAGVPGTVRDRGAMPGGANVAASRSSRAGGTCPRSCGARRFVEAAEHSGVAPFRCGQSPSSCTTASEAQ
jgi:hypothetical protein